MNDETIADFIAHWDSFRKVTFWNSRGSADQRRAYERRNYRCIDLEYENNNIQAEIQLKCLSRKVKIFGTIVINGRKSTIDELKKIYKFHVEV